MQRREREEWIRRHAASGAGTERLLSLLERLSDADLTAVESRLARPAADGADDDEEEAVLVEPWEEPDAMAGREWRALQRIHERTLNMSRAARRSNTRPPVARPRAAPRPGRPRRRRRWPTR